MKMIEQLLEQLRETNSALAQMDKMLLERPDDDFTRVNAEAIRKRHDDLERRLNSELRTSQLDLVEYHVDRSSDQYPALAVARAIAGFQEIVTAVFDAMRTTPKQRYRPAAENVALSTLDFAMALPIGSVVISLSVENERLLAIKSDLDRTFEEVFKLLNSSELDNLREIAAKIGIAPIAKAHDWAENASYYGLNTSIKVKKDLCSEIVLNVTADRASKLKEAIEEKSDEKFSDHVVIGELVGIDVDRPKTYFHIKSEVGENLEGRLAETFPFDREWAVHVVYIANLIKVSTIRYATGEEKIEWILANLVESDGVA